MGNDLQSLKLLYKKYKDTTIYHGGVFILVIVVCLLLLLTVVMPQYEAFMAMREEVIATRERIQIINNNIAYLQKLNDDELEANFTIAMNALPSEKDYVGLINAISSSSLASGVLIDDFNFSVGKLASESAEPSLQRGIELELLVKGDLESANGFIKEMNEYMPLSEALSLDLASDGSTIKLKFYNKPVPLITYANDSPIQPLDEQTLAVIRRLEQWKKAEVDINSVFNASGSSNLADPF